MPVILFQAIQRFGKTLRETFLDTDHRHTAQNENTFECNTHDDESAPTEEQGVAVEEHQASCVYEKAIEEGGDVDAMFNLGNLLLEGGHGFGVDMKRAVALYERAIEEGGHCGAMFNLGNLLLEGGDGVGVDMKRAVALYERASEGGDHMRSVGRCVEKKCRERWELGELMDVKKFVGDRNGIGKDNKRYDFFISHAGTEKHNVAYPLREELESNGLSTFLDQEKLRGSQKTSRDQLYDAMNASKGAVFILTIDFVKRKWPIMELQHFLKRWKTAEEKGGSKPLLIPIFFGLEVEDCKDLELPTRDYYIKGFRAEGCFKRTGEASMTSAMEAVREVTKFTGVRNDEKLEGEEFVSMMGKKIYEYFVKI